ncbi:hypothetical protein EU546_02835 [Candidatus Thorarchaeota archaeon]|nr:MAG: hypothetical protein EU546_02835 [Candidatus Thorarchaeota archaeon]
MPLTQVLLTWFLVFVGLILSILSTAYGEKRYPQSIGVSVIIPLILVPASMLLLYSLILPHVTAMDWWWVGTFRGWVVNPFIVIVVITWPGWLMGHFAGKYWVEDNDRSCLQCMLGPIFLLLLASVALILVP